ncbi:MAG: aminotransferase class V-fold PLP-dependent enzyme [Chloroherpetonaceae bacterium]|nr:aminotransferase class V-fold PLP-dependent enzyme [Chloroherpetonaceae bacterium]MDW8437268.1 aminotransferase class V-fold PLP-dependent enzyme [Chloroherpetonaceae bacterium]
MTSDIQRDKSPNARLDAESARALFPNATRGIYFNHAAVSPLSLRVVSAVERYLKERSETDVENYSATLLPTLQALRSRLARYLNAKERNLAFVPNTSYGLNLLAQGLDWKPGDRVLLYEREFPANVQPFLALRSRGVAIDFLKDHCGEISLDELERRIAPRTRLVSLSYVQFLSGYRLDLAAVSDICRRKSVLLSIDAIQGFGAFPIDCSKVDFLAAGAHKWGMSPMGTGVAYFSDALLERLNPVFVGWLSVEEAWDFSRYEKPLKRDASRYELGTYNWIGLVGMNAAFELFEEIGYEQISNKILALSERLSVGLKEAGFELECDPKREHRSGIVSVKNVPNAAEAFKALAERGIEISLRENYLRFSPHFYNSLAECDEAISQLKRLKP